MYVIFLAILVCFLKFIAELSEGMKIDAATGEHMVDDLLLHLHEILESDVLLTCAARLFVMGVSLQMPNIFVNFLERNVVNEETLSKIKH